MFRLNFFLNLRQILLFELLVVPLVISRSLSNSNVNHLQIGSSNRTGCAALTCAAPHSHACDTNRAQLSQASDGRLPVSSGLFEVAAASVMEG